MVTVFCLLALQAGSTAFAAAVVKNVQRGSSDLGVNPRTVTITAVDTSKAYVIASFRSNSSDANIQPTFELTNATTLTFTSYKQSADIKIEWEVVEFVSDVSVQRGLSTMSTLNTANDAAPQTLNVPITSAPTNKSFVLVSQRYNDQRQNIDENWTPMARLTSATNLELSRNEASNPLEVAWQVVTFSATDPTTVQFGVTSIVSKSTTTTVGITSVDLTKSFLLLNRRASERTGGVEGEYMVWGKFDTSTQLRFTRFASNNKVDISWFVVTLGPESSVLSGEITMGNGVKTLNASIPAVDVTQSMTYVSVAGGNPDVNRYDECVVSNKLISNGTALQFDRYGDGVTAYGVWFVVEFSFRAVYKETADLDGDGLIDAIRCLAFEPVNDDFSNINVTVAGYTVTGFSTGLTANDREFYILLQERTLPADTGDTNATPAVQIVSNASLRGTTSTKLVRAEPAALPAMDRAQPVMMACDWLDGSGGGVSATDFLYLRMSEPVTATSVAISHLALPVTGDTLDATSVVQNVTSSTTITVSLMGQPLFTPGGVYAVSSLAPGAASGILINNGVNIRDAVNLTALNQTFSTAVDIRPGNVVVAIAWPDLTNTKKVWNLTASFGTAYTASSAFPPNALEVRNIGNVRVTLNVVCTATASPGNWQIAATSALDKYEMKLLDGALEKDLVTSQVLTTGMYSGQQKPFDLRFVAPSDISNEATLDAPQSITITVVATQN